MKTNHASIGAILASLFFSLAAFSQTPPPNDNYSNSIALTGTDITFSGTLAGATIEDSQETSAYYAVQGGNFYAATQSIWWTWTAPTDTVVTLEVLDASYQPPLTGFHDVIAFYSATNGSLSPEGLTLPALGAMFYYPPDAPMTFSVPVTGGSNYQIQLIGNSSSSYTLRLVATNTPAIITQPRSQTVYSNASALFYVVYAGIGQTNFTFQWFFNGTNLPDETAPMLALTNIDSSMTGNYTVAVSNSAGSTLGAPATLTISQSNFPVSLTAIGPVVTNFPGSLYWASSAFAFLSVGEAGRTYRLQSSTNLVNWASESDFAVGYGTADVTSVFFQTNRIQILSSPTVSNLKYFRVIPYVTNSAHAEICLNNLRAIRIAKLLWQRDSGYGFTATPFASDLAPYFPHKTLPLCPDDGLESFHSSYSIRNLGQNPHCVVYDVHALEEPR